MRATSIAFLFALTTISNPAYAQTDKPAVNILIEDLGANADECGVTEDAIYSAASSALRYNRLRTGASNIKNATLYLNVNLKPFGNICAINASVYFYKYERVQTDFVGSIFTKLLFCDNSALGLGRGGSVLNSTIKDLIDSCLAETPPAVLEVLG